MSDRKNMTHKHYHTSFGVHDEKDILLTQGVYGGPPKLSWVRIVSLSSENLKRYRVVLSVPRSVTLD